MKQNRNRKELKTKMAQALNDNLQNLTIEMKNILIDDLVTAFENRLQILSHAQSSLQCLVEVGVEVPQ